MSRSIHLNQEERWFFDSRIGVNLRTLWLGEVDASVIRKLRRRHLRRSCICMPGDLS